MGLKSACPLATLSNIYIDISDNNTNYVYELTPTPSAKIVSLRGGQRTEIAVYDIKAHSSKGIFNVAAIYNTPKSSVINYPSILYANRYIIGM
jgi:phosphatidylinositol glycan class T